mgnify:FL=1
MDERQIRHTFELLKKPEDVIEVRCITSRSNYSGYFKNVDNIIKELPRYSNGNVYFVLNKISDGCYSREQHETFVEKAKNTTSDGDISLREWLLIDVDPKRPSGVSSTNEEKNNAKLVINNVFSFLRDIGFAEPIVCDSGNGFHLLYKISLENTEANKLLMQTVLQVLDLYFSNGKCDIDKTVFNASRITKLYGTDSKKGNNTDDRPHRQSSILKVPKAIKETPYQLLLKVAGMMPAPEEKTYQNNYGKDRFDLKSFIRENNINVKSELNFQGGTKYILDHCLFDHSHKSKDAALFELQNGAVAYKCLHNSCSGYKWQDVRKMFEPNAYEKYYEPQTRRITEKREEIVPQAQMKEKGSKFLNFSEIEAKDRTQIVSIPSGFTQLDKMIIGFNKGEVSLWSGKNGAAKSTIINQIAINAVDKNFKGVIFSGELPSHKMKNWVHLQCAGRQFTQKNDKFDNLFFVKKSVSEKIDFWLKDKLFVYNNEYGNNFEQLMCDVEEFVVEKGIDFVILDNLMALSLLTLDGDKYERQTQFINRICTSVKKFNYHIHIIAHPRKQTGFLRKDDISGNADLTNAVDNVFIAHRNNNDYKRAIGDFFPKEMFAELTRCDNYIEVCKNRDLGVIDYLVGFYYEIESKRLLNEMYENRTYGWQDMQSQTEITPTVYVQPNVNFYEPKSDPFDGGDLNSEVPF